MVKVSVKEHEIRMEGHAEMSVNGQDIVCAAISALTCNLINSLQTFTDDIILTREACAGWVSIEWEKLSDTGKLLVASWYLGLTAINQEYNCIKFV